jgi:hypothetical protein
MTYYAGYELDYNIPPHLTNFSIYGSCFALRNIDSAINPVSATWTTGNQARYYPISIPFAYPVHRVFWANGSAVAGTRDFGIYTKEYKLIYSTGSQSATGGTALQYYSTGLPIILQPGDYYFGFNCSATTNAVWGKTVGAESQRYAGILQQAVGATTLPDPMVPATASVASINICGITWTPSGFA